MSAGARIVSLSGLLLSAVLAQPAQAAGFALIENSASGMGVAFAGAAASAEDASTVWFNPAGMSFISTPQLAVAGHVVAPKADFSDRGSYVNPALTGGTVVPGSLTGRNDDGGTLALVPNFYYVRPLSDALHFGLGINAPFGLVTEYADDWVGRYHAIKSDLLTININPAVSWSVSPRLQIGGGISAQYIDVELSNAIDSAAVCAKVAAQDATFVAQCVGAGLMSATGVPNIADATQDGKAVVTGDDWSFGFNLGLIYDFSDATRLGVSYRSEIKQELEGNAKFTVNPLFAGTFSNTTAAAKATLPQSLSVSMTHQFNSRLQILADVTWTGWSSFDELRVTFGNGLDDAVTDEAWEDVLRYSLGAQYALNDTWTLRTGIALDEEPIPDEQHRTPRIPGNDRTWLAFGAGWHLSERFHVDVGYAHLFVDDTAIDHVDDNGYAIRGVYEAAVDIVSAQLNWTL